MDLDPKHAVQTAPRVRIAPSPTGGLHVGTARTALFNWLYARKNHGTFVLRVEDTDRARSTKEFEKAIIADLKWLGLEWDEGPIRQTDRTEVYAKYLQKLLDSGSAYRCYCTPEQLAEDRKSAIAAKKAPIYSGRCTNLSAKERAACEATGTSGVVRFATPKKTITVRDEIHGELTFHGKDFGDFVIARADNSPLFMLVNLIDDADMKISHVIRGDDHLPNLPKQVFLAEALGFSIPVYAHVPLILNSDRSKMSKRAGPTHVGEYRKLGYLPEALTNYIALLGWNPGTTQEIFTRDELTKAFNLRQINKAGSIFDLHRLQWMNGQYLRALSLEQLLNVAKPFWPDEARKAEDSFKERALTTVRERISHLAELSDLTRFYFLPALEFSKELLTWKKSTPEESITALKSVRNHLADLPEETFKSTKKIEEALKAHVTGAGLSVGEVFWPLRVSLSGSKTSPGPQEILWVLGRDVALERIDHALKK